MTSLYELNDFSIYLYACQLILLLTGSLLLHFKSFMSKTRLRMKVAIIFILLCEVIMYQYIIVIARNKENNIPMNSEAHIPYLIVSGFILLALTGNIHLFYVMKRIERFDVSHRSIKSAVDNSPVGICIYNKYGGILLLNKVMNDISLDLNFNLINNGVTFFDFIRTLNINKENKEVIIKLNDKYYLFIRNEIVIDKLNKKYIANELLAIDITEEYQLNVELQLKSQYLQSYTEELRNYRRKIVQVTTEEEILNTKIRIHDDLGQLLLITKTLRNDSTINEKTNVINKWKYTYSRLLTSIEQEENESFLDDLIEAGKAIGVNLATEGKIPNNKIVLTMIHECLTNTYRHSCGNTLFVKAYKEGNKFILECSNEGESCDNIEFKGGLKSLNDLVIKNGGKLYLVKGDRFTMRLELLNL